MAASNLRNAKKLLRKEMKQILNALTEEALALQSAIVTRRLLKDEVYKSARSLSIFLHMPDEVRTTNILRDALEAGKKCYVPRYFTDGGGREMEMVLLRDWDDYEGLPRTKWNIKQPADDEVRQEALDDTEVGLDLILMPGLAFTPDGRRLGRGKGYYDTYLEKCRSAMGPGRMPKTVALAYHEQVIEEIPTDEHDFRIDKVIFGEGNST